MNYSTYILLCENDKYYIGNTNNLKNRFDYHLKKWGSKFTQQNKPVKILWYQKFNSRVEAMNREKQIKGLTRNKKEKLINKEWC